MANSTGTMRAKARELQAGAARLPLARAPRTTQGAGREFFAQIDRELVWGLTLNK